MRQQQVAMAPWHMAVLIPARDEEDLLPRCLRSVAAARRALPQGVTSDVVVVSDRSSDATVETAQRMLGSMGHVAQSDAGRVGCARALAAELALNRFCGQMERCWLANTDADCDVPEDWLVRQLTLARRGYAAAAGIVDVDSFEEHDDAVEERFRLTYRIGEDGSHPHVHGANPGRARRCVSDGWRLGQAGDGRGSRSLEQGARAGVQHGVRRAAAGRDERPA